MHKTFFESHTSGAIVRDGLAHNFLGIIVMKIGPKTCKKASKNIIAANTSS